MEFLSELSVDIQSSLAPYYFYIKFIHIFFVIFWVGSTAQAFSHYLVPAFQAWRLNPDDPKRIKQRDIAMERFDSGVIYEHIAFPIVLLSGLLLLWISGFNGNSGWLVLKLSIVIAIMIPLESIDYYLSHFGGNKGKLRKAGDMETHEIMTHYHWMFFLVTTPLILSFVASIIFLAVVKPF